MAKILIVEDHQNLCVSLRECIEKEGYAVDVAENLKSASEKILTGPDLVVLDWMLPDGQGIDFLMGIRKQRNHTPIIFLTARVDLVDKVLGLETGANDYMTKPFEPRELLARIRARLRDKLPDQKLPAEPSATLTVGPLTIDRLQHKVSFRGGDVNLVKKEFDLLVLLAESPEKVFPRDEILNKVWGYEVFPTTRTVDTHVMLLRQKTHDDLIETVRSVGYRLKRM